MFPRHLNLREKQNIFLINNNGMPKETATAPQPQEKTMWALTELELKAAKKWWVGGVLRLQNAGAGYFLELWL